MSLFSNRRLAALAWFTAIVAVGCASRPPAEPVPFDNIDVREWKNKRIALTGRVDGFESFLGPDHGSMTFTLVGGAADDLVLCSESGHNVFVLTEVATLLLRAEDRGTPVTVIGTVRVGPYGEIQEGARLEMDSVRVDGNLIDTDHNDHARYSTWGPVFIDDC